MNESDLRTGRSSEAVCEICGRTGVTHWLALISNRAGNDTEFTAVICPECAELCAEAFAVEGVEQ